jgi:hypothetical protein
VLISPTECGMSRCTDYSANNSSWLFRCTAERTVRHSRTVCSHRDPSTIDILLVFVVSSQAGCYEYLPEEPEYNAIFKYYFLERGGGVTFPMMKMAVSIANPDRICENAQNCT